MKHLLRQDISVYTTSTLNRYGEETWTGAISKKARVQRTDKKVINPQGEQQQAELQIFLINENGDMDDLAVGDKITYNSIDYRIIALKSSIDDIGSEHHLTAHLVRWQ